MTASKELLIGAVILLLFGMWRGWTKGAVPWSRRWAEILLPLLLGALAFAYYETAGLNTRWVWSACRLAPALGMFHGYPLYSPEDTGPINGWLYGPIAALLWSPAALAGSPRLALAVAAVINLLFLLCPLLVASGRGAAEAGGSRLLAFVFGAAALLQIYPTWYMASALNVDAIAVGLGAGSCLLLLSENPTGGRRLMMAAGLSALAAWTKQVEAPLVLAQLGWLWFTHGRGAALKFGAAYAVTMVVVTAAVFSAWGMREVVFNMWTVPSAHALPGGWTAARAELVDFFRYTWILWLPGLAGLWFHAKADAVPDAERPPGTRHPLLLLVAAAAVLLPFGIAASIKVGGDRNSIHSVYYLAVAAILALTGLRASVAFRRPWLLPGAILAASVALTFLAVRQVAGYGQLPMLPPRCLSEEAWLFARERPGHVYYPWDPLATLMSDGRMYHFEYGVLDRIYAGRPPDPTRLPRDLPAQMEIVIYPRADYPRTMVKNYLTKFHLANATEDWLIHRPTAQPPPSTPAK